MIQLVFRIRKTRPNLNQVNFIYYPEKAIKIDKTGKIIPDEQLDWKSLSAHGLTLYADMVCYTEEEARNRINSFIRYYKDEEEKKKRETLIYIDETLTIN